MNRDTSIHALLPLSLTHTHAWTQTHVEHKHMYVCTYTGMCIHQTSQGACYQRIPLCVCMDKTGVGRVFPTELPPTDGSDQHLKSEERNMQCRVLRQHWSMWYGFCVAVGRLHC